MSLECRRETLVFLEESRCSPCRRRRQECRGIRFQRRHTLSEPDQNLLAYTVEAGSGRCGGQRTQNPTPECRTFPGNGAIRPPTSPVDVELAYSLDDGFKFTVCERREVHGQDYLCLPCNPSRDFTLVHVQRVRANIDEHGRRSSEHERIDG